MITIKLKLDEHGVPVIPHKPEWALQKARARVDFEFDLNEKTYTLTATMKASKLEKMDLDEIKEWIIPKVEAKRAEIDTERVEAVLDPLVDIDLEQDTE
jgi:hypothetical protein